MFTYLRLTKAELTPNIRMLEIGLLWGVGWGSCISNLVLKPKPSHHRLLGRKEGVPRVRGRVGFGVGIGVGGGWG